MKQYLDLMRHVYEHGTHKEDRTGTGTTSVFGYQMRFDLSEGFPVVTTKKLHLRSIIHELLWFLKGDTNIAYLKENGVRIWDDWSLNAGNYPNPKRLTGWIRKRSAIRPDLYSGNYSSNGVNAVRYSVDDNLRNIWTKMMKRCYDKKSHNYSFYGGRGAFVCKEWHDCKTFIADVKKLQNWDLKQNSWNDFELDKDYYGAMAYSPQTSVWLHSSENSAYTGEAIAVTVDGVESCYVSIAHASESTGVPTTTIHRWLESERHYLTRYKGMSAKRIMKQEYVFRFLFTEGELGPVYGHQWRSWPKPDGGTIDQISNVVEMIKTNPDSRRLIVTAWNPAEVDKMALPPCHAFFQFYVADGKLSCQLYQRSADIFLGGMYA